MAIHMHKNDLPKNLDLGTSVAIDTETMGLNPHRDRLCLVQLSSGDGDAHLVKIANPRVDTPQLKALLADPSSTKLFHFARFDIGALLSHFNVITTPVFCTKIASKLVRTYTDKHGLKNLINEQKL